METIKVLIAEDHELVRKGLIALLGDEPDILVIAEASDGRDAIAQVEQKAPDVVLLDIGMRRMNGLEAARQIKHYFPQVKVLMLTVHEDEEYILQSMQAGAEGYVVKGSAPADLVQAVRTVYEGGSYLSPHVSRNVIMRYVQLAGELPDASQVNPLTGREREVLQLTAEGWSCRQISEYLVISEKTVRSHRSNIMEKLGLHNTAELTLYAVRRGYISLES